jgi:hypothetical protein
MRAIALAGVLGVVPAVAQAGATSDSLLELTGVRGPALSLGFGVAPLQWEVLAPPAPTPGAEAAESAVLFDTEPRSRAVSFDIKLRWPGAESASPLEPYLVLGPALYVEEPGTLLGVDTDPVVRLGAKAGAGFNWRLGKTATLFGAYDLTTTDVGGLMSPGARTPATGGGLDGYDILYGIRFRY